MQRTPVSQQLFPGLDLLRLLAALLVVLFHLGFKAISDPDGLIATHTAMAPWQPETWRLTWLGWVGVQVFFVISGLVIALSADRPGQTPAGFLRSRVLRLVPVVLIASVFALVVELAVFGLAPATALTRFAATVAFWPLPPWIMGQFWTLGIEIGFYALVLALMRVGRVGRHLPTLALGLIAVTTLYWTVLIVTGGQDPIERITRVIPLQHGAYFGIGILLTDQVRRGGRWWHWAGLALGLAAASLQIRMAAVWEGGAAISARHWSDAYLVFAASVASAFLSLRVGHGRMSDRSLAMTRTLGLATYPLYLLHNHAGKPVMLLLFGLGMPAGVAVTVAILVCLGLSLGVARWVEPPVRDLCKGVYGFVANRLRWPGRAKKPARAL